MTLDWNTLEKIARVHGESFYLLNTRRFERNYDRLLSAFRGYYPNTSIAYSYKTNYTPRLCKLVDEKGGFAEVVSEMEYDLAIRLGISPKRIIVNGPYKPAKALLKFLLNGSLVNLDCEAELNALELIAIENPEAELKVGIRCNFEVSASFVSRFGFDARNGLVARAITRVRQLPNVRLQGLQCHFPNRNLDSFRVRADRMLVLAQELLPGVPTFIDLGGGFFGEMPTSLEQQFHTHAVKVEEYAQVIGEKFARAYGTGCGREPELIIEPGTALVADTMTFVTRVMDVKRVADRIIAVTAGSRFNLGQWIPGPNLPLTVHTGRDLSDLEGAGSIDFAGYTCIESDLLYRGYQGPLSVGDYAAFDNVGSYSLVFKPPFILPNVPVLEYDETRGDVEILKRRESLDDVFCTYAFSQPIHVQ